MASEEKRLEPIFLLLAAGKGSRLYPQTKSIPKSLIKIGNKRIFDFFIEAAKDIEENSDVYIATGHGADEFNDLDVKCIYNDKYSETNMLYTLWNSLKHINIKDRSLFVSYSDIIFPSDTFSKISTKNEMTIAVDTRWEPNYVGRTLHGIDQCEKCLIDSDNNLLTCSKKLPFQNSLYSEYLGILYIPSILTLQIKEKLDQVFSRKYLPNPFMFSDSLKQSYITDFLSYLVCQGSKIQCVDIIDKWFEIDTEQDVINAQKILK